MAIQHRGSIVDNPDTPVRWYLIYSTWIGNEILVVLKYSCRIVIITVEFIWLQVNVNLCPLESFNNHSDLSIQLGISRDYIFTVEPDVKVAPSSLHTLRLAFHSVDVLNRSSWTVLDGTRKCLIIILCESVRTVFKTSFAIRIIFLTAVSIFKAIIDA
jgi:hypothetical protein